MNSNLSLLKENNLRLIIMDLTKNKAPKTKKYNDKPTVVLMTRWHAIYRCKSRLSKDIGAFNAAKIQEKLTNHTIKVAKEIQKEGIADIKVAIDGIGNQEARNFLKGERADYIRLR